MTLVHLLFSFVGKDKLRTAVVLVSSFQKVFSIRMDGTTSPRKTRADNSHQVASPHPSYPSVNARMSSAIPDAMAAALDPMAAALMARRNLEDEQARLLMQQHYQAGDALVAAAMARASSNLMASGQFPLVNQDALLYQRALLERQAGIGSLGFVAPPDQTRLAQNLAPADARAKDALSDEPSPEIDSTESKSSENDVDSDDEATSKGENEEDEDDFKTEDQNSKHRPYFDRSLLPDPPSGEESSEEDGISKLPNAPSKKPIEPFPEKLYRIIEEAKENGQENIISFFPHGRAVGIHKPKMFIDEIMPKYFATHRMASFQRQLNLCKYCNVSCVLYSIVTDTTIVSPCLFLHQMVFDALRKVKIRVAFIMNTFSKDARVL